MTDVSLTNLAKAFDDTWAVEDLNLEIASGEMVALLGPSGCGKTTTLRMITGLIRPTSGDVLFDGDSVVGVPTERRGAVLVFQKHLLFPTMTVGQNVGFGLKMAGVDKTTIKRRVAEMLERVELPGFADRKAHELSGGQQQRIALARGLVTHPRVLLLDEPLANLDANLRITMRQLIRGIQRDLDITSIFVTHDQEEAVMLADRVALMFDGRIQQVGQPQEFYQKPRTSRVARFFRSENLLSVVRRGDVVTTGAGDLVVGDGVVPTGDGPVLITVRPEAVRLANDSGAENTLHAKVVSSIYMGTHTQLIVQLGESTWSLQAPASSLIKAGDQVFVELPREDIWILEDEPKDLSALQKQLASMFELGDVRVVATPPSESALRGALANGTARWLEEQLRPGLVVGIGLGRTVALIPKTFDPVGEVDCVFITVEGVGDFPDAEYAPYNVVSEFAAQAGGALETISAPTFAADMATRDQLLTEPSVSASMATARNADIVIQSVGTLGSDATLYRHGTLNESALKRLKAAGAVGDALGHFIDESGEPVPWPTDDVHVGLTLADLRNLKISTLVAGGADKVDVIRAALRGRYFNILVTDEETAQLLLEVGP